MNMSKEHFKRTFKLAQDSNTPIYTQLADYLKHQIQSGVLKPGDKMIGENDIVNMLGISRTTVRLSLDRLVDEGLIVRYRGKGSYIAEPRLRRNINYLYNFTENIRASGAYPSSIVIHSGITEADASTKEKLHLAEEGTNVFLLERLRLANGEPLIIEKTYIPYYLCHGIESIDFATSSLYTVLENRYGLNICRAEETIEAIVIDKDVCKQLSCKPCMPGYKIERISYLESGYICEYTTSITRSDKCIFKLDLYNSKSAKSGSIDFKRQLFANKEQI